MTYIADNLVDYIGNIDTESMIKSLVVLGVLVVLLIVVATWSMLTTNYKGGIFTVNTMEISTQINANSYDVRKYYMTGVMDDIKYRVLLTKSDYDKISKNKIKEMTAELSKDKYAEENVPWTLKSFEYQTTEQLKITEI